MDERLVVLTGKEPEKPETNDYHVEKFESKKALAKQLKRFEESDVACLFIIHSDVDKLFRHVTGCFKYIEAAGGLVTHPDGRILLIERLGVWDLPKGKAEKGESLQETAIREVVEECGLKNAPVITGELTHTYHTYYRNDIHYLKHTAWYTMLYDGDDVLHPQSSEDITKAIWLSQNQLNIIQQKTYKSIKQVIRNYELGIRNSVI
jgi:8-oxo-dGTP pyrophosphatase MutT (NUDIX family)